MTLSATPPDWANYGQMFTDFTAKYGIKVDYRTSWMATARPRSRRRTT